MKRIRVTTVICIGLLVIVWGIIFNSLIAYVIAAVYALLATGINWLINRALFGKKDDGVRK